MALDSQATIPPMKIELTKANVLTLPEGEHFDTEIPRLVLRVRSKSRRYVLRYEAKGETVRLGLGDVGLVSLKAAREHARALLTGIWKGIDPREALRREATAGLSVGDLCDRCLAEIHVSAATRKEYLRIRAVELLPIAEVSAHQLSQRRIIDLLADIQHAVRPAAGTKKHAKERKPSGYVANRTFELLRRVYAWGAAPERQMVAGSPLAGMRKPFDGEREDDRYLSTDELRAFLLALDDLQDAAFRKTERKAGDARATAATLLALTGVRLRAMTGARAEEFEALDDPKAAVWHVPAERMKAGRAHVVPLSTQAAALVTRRLKEVDGGPLLFPSVRATEGHEHMWWKASWVDKLKDGLDRHLGRAAAPWKIHNLRHTLATHMSEDLEVNEAVIDMVLSHAGPAMRRRYNRAVLLPQRREALQRWADWLDGLRRAGIKEATGTAGGRQQ